MALGIICIVIGLALFLIVAWMEWRILRFDRERHYASDWHRDHCRNRCPYP